ncbi:MAG: endonuclease/exonuclease/phosphatase family protein [Candidatus Sumerlaeaceae bacterium]|nr:endonuclease/exonuclease/phosphatase family protein [Candidatus Sumerlaeaceae bacterium]
MSIIRRGAALVLVCIAAALPAGAQTQIRIMASNITSGNNQQYLSPGQNILKAMKPDVVCMQEFNVTGANDDAAVTSFVSSVFGAGYYWYREPKATANIPNGFISKYPIIASGEWDDTQVSDRDFVWAQIDIPGPIDLYVISVHLLTASATVRNTEAQQIINTYLPTLSIPSNAYLAIAGDFNTDNRSESCLSTFSSKFVTTSPYPAGQDGDGDTNSSRSKPYDWVLVNSNLNAYKVASVFGTYSYTNGLVFDTRNFNQTQLNSYFSPCLTTDSSATNMQHMAVVKTFVVPGSSTTSNGDTVSVSTTNRAPSTIAAGASASMLSIILTANSGEWDAGTVTLNRLGTLTDGNVTAKIYLDDDQDGVADAGESLLGSGSFSSGSCTITLSPAPRTDSGLPIHLLAVATTNGASPDASTLQFQLAANGLTFNSSGGTDTNPTFSAASSGTSTITNAPPPAVVAGNNTVVVNKYYNDGTVAANDVVELLVIKDQLDMRGMIIKDFSSSMGSDGGGKYTFANHSLWSSLRAGTVIILRNGNSAADTTVGGSDFTLDVGMGNTTYFTGTGTFDIAGTEMVMIKEAGSGTAGVTSGIHTLASGTAGANYTAAPTPKLRASTTTGNTSYCYANNTNGSTATASLLSNFTDGSGTATGGATGLTFGQGNTTDNTNFITFLRGPNATGGTSSTVTSFVANWDSLITAAGYHLDVSTNSNFSSYVDGFQDLDVGNVTSYEVTGLDFGNYYYRVRGVNSEGTTSGNSTATSASAVPVTMSSWQLD